MYVSVGPSEGIAANQRACAQSRRWFTRASLILGAVSFFFAANIDSVAASKGQLMPLYVKWLIVAGFVLIWPAYVWAGRLFMRLWRWCETQWRIVGTPIPSPQEIAYEIQRQYGRPATIEEVQAFSQMLHQRRNEAALKLGALVAGSVIAGKLADR